VRYGKKTHYLSFGDRIFGGIGYISKPIFPPFLGPNFKKGSANLLNFGERNTYLLKVTSKFFAIKPNYINYGELCYV
jgi:hypothetical protein